MTHGEETGPETHQDSAVLTYLEGLLMHRVAGAQSATATQRCEAEKGNKDQGNKETTGLTVPKHSTQQEQDKTSPKGGSTHHVKKARLLRSEAWTEHESQMRSLPSAELNGEKQEHHGGLHGSLQCKGESTLLASLLQNFSTRLQNVALSQQSVQNLVPQKATQSSDNKPDQEDKSPGDSHGFGPILTRSSTVPNHSNSLLYHQHQSSQERLSKSPIAIQHNAFSPSSESLPCTERLRAVANLVNIRSSPALSPKPSVACSQLALLLSSEAHLQQYSREHALKAQRTGRSASERLAAMASHQTQERNQPGHSQTNQDGRSPMQTRDGILLTSSSRQSPGLSTGQSKSLGSMRRTHPFRDRRPFERHGRPSQNCSSLLLQLLNSHNTSQQLNCEGHLKDSVSIFSSRGSPMFSDSERSNSANSLPKDSSDVESSRSSCSPIDLSLKNKVNISLAGSLSSTPPLDKVTESQTNRWILESTNLNMATERTGVHSCSEMKPHHKVTLLELLLDQKHYEKTKKDLDNQVFQPLPIPAVSSASTSNQTLFHIGRCKDTRERSPDYRLNTRNPKLLPTLPQSRDSNIQSSPYNQYTSPHTQSVPLDLCKSKPPVCSTSGVKEKSFSASKLLQNLAHCGKQNVASSPKASLPPVKRQTEEFKTSTSAALLERHTGPIKKNNALSWEVAHGNSPTSFESESTHHNSEIENLLERRTVLQLLLGNKSQKERSGNKRKRESESFSEKLPNHSKGHNLNILSPDILVKTEPMEDDATYIDSKVTKTCHSILTKSHKQSSHTFIKQEPLSPLSVSRDERCHLLNHQPRNLNTNTLESSSKGSIKEEPMEHQRLTIPNNRKVLVEQEDPAEMSPQRRCNSSGSHKDNSDCSTSGMSETKEASDPSSPPEANSPPARFPPYETPRNENGGFNVLKQLLLSDNCLKELAQSRSTFSTLTRPALNGSTKKEPCSNGELHGFHQTLNPNKMRAEINRVASLSDDKVKQQDSSRLKQGSTSQRFSKASVRLVNGDKTQDCKLDSPRLTKANPILYYMLQKSNAHLVRDGVELEAKSGPCRVQMKDKEESKAFDLQLNLPQKSHNHNGTQTCDSPQLNGSLKKS